MTDFHIHATVSKVDILALWFFSVHSNIYYCALCEVLCGVVVNATSLTGHLRNKATLLSQKSRQIFQFLLIPPPCSLGQLPLFTIKWTETLSHDNLRSSYWSLFGLPLQFTLSKFNDQGFNLSCTLCIHNTSNYYKGWTCLLHAYGTLFIISHSCSWSLFYVYT